MRRSLYLFFFSMLLLACSSCRQQAEDAAAVADSTAITADVLSVDEQGPAVRLDAPLILAYSFREGDTFGYQIRKMESISMFRDSLLEEKNDVNITRWYTFKVLEAYPQGGGRLLAECDRVLYDGQYSGPSGKREMTYDSREANASNVERLLSEFNAPVGHPFEVVIAPDGRIAAVEKLDGVIRNFMKEDYATTKSDQIKAITQDYAQTGIKSVLQLVFQKLHDKPVAEDSSWVILSAQKLGYLSLRDDAVYTLKSITGTDLGKLAHIGVRLRSLYTGNPSFDTGQGMATMKDFDIAGVGRTSFNIDVGRVHRRSIKNSVFVNMFVEPPDDLKRMAPDQARNHWWSQKAATEDSIEPYTR
jgi:hypothetical protein